MHNAGPRSLEFQRQPAAEVQAGEGRGFAVKALLALGGYYSRESSHMRAAQRLYTAVTEQAASPQFLQSEWVPGRLLLQLCRGKWLVASPDPLLTCPPPPPA